MKSFQGIYDKKRKFIPKSGFLNGMGGNKHLLNMGSFSEFAIAQNTLIDNFSKKNCYDLVEVTIGMGDMNPRTGALESIVEVTFELEKIERLMSSYEKEYQERFSQYSSEKSKFDKKVADAV